MSILRIGLIGFGAFTRNAYLPALQYDERAEVTAVTAASEQTRQYAKELFGEKVTVYHSYETLLKHPELDAVMVAVPDRFHHSVLSDVVSAGIPVFYEPPIADTREEMLAMINCLLNSRQQTFADLELGYHPAIARTVQLISTGTIGALHKVTITLNSNWGANPQSDICLLNHMACWYVDVLNRIIGSIPSRVLVLDGYGNSGRKQTISTGIFDYSGIWGIINANISSPDSLLLHIEITGDKGEIFIDFLKGELCYRTNELPEWRKEDSSPLKPYADWPGVREAVSAFLDAVENSSDYGNVDTVVKLNLIGLALEESKDLGTWITIK